ncbi:MAG: hypothetical protein PHQ43_11045 [Dehalococcoidales bacterium]|nr:hypothetical protein [Dehalococcoidales bacterium]
MIRNTTTAVETTRVDIREMFRKWGIDRSEYDIEWEPNNSRGQRMPGAIVHYLRQGKLIMKSRGAK